MINIPKQYQVNRKIALKTILSGSMKPVEKKRLKDCLKGVQLTHQIQGESIPSFIDELHRYEVIMFFNVQLDNIKKAVLKGTGQLPGAVYEEITYEGYGPGKTAVIVECTTDNKNRTFSEIRNIFTKRNGTIGTTGCVSYMFKKKGFISILKSAIDEDKLMEIAIEAGADDIKTDDEKYFEILTDPENFDTVKEALEKQNIPLETAEITMLADTDVKIKDKKTAEQIFKFMEGLESHDDTKNVYSNFDIDEEIIKQLG